MTATHFNYILSLCQVIHLIFRTPSILPFLYFKYNILAIVYFSYFLEILNNELRYEEVKHMKWLDNTLLTLAIIGCVVWGLIGFFQFNLVSFLFGNGTWLTRIIYALVGLSGLYIISFYGRIRSTLDD